MFAKLLFLTVRNFSSRNLIGPVQRTITEKLNQRFLPSHLDIHCESHLHHDKGAERHFRIQIVSKEFEGLSPLQMHRLVNKCLAEELAGQIHAIRIDAHPPSSFTGNVFPPTSASRAIQSTVDTLKPGNLQWLRDMSYTLTPHLTETTRPNLSTRFSQTLRRVRPTSGLVLKVSVFLGS